MRDEKKVEFELFSDGTWQKKEEDINLSSVVAFGFIILIAFCILFFGKSGNNNTPQAEHDSIPTQSFEESYQDNNTNDYNYNDIYKQQSKTQPNGYIQTKQRKNSSDTSDEKKLKKIQKQLEKDLKKQAKKQAKQEAKQMQQEAKQAKADAKKAAKDAKKQAKLEKKLKKEQMENNSQVDDE